MFSCCWGCLYFHLPLAAQIIEKGLQIFPPLFLPFFLKSLNISFFFFTFSHLMFPVSRLVYVTRSFARLKLLNIWQLTPTGSGSGKEERRRGECEREGKRKSGNAKERTCQRRGGVNESHWRVWKRGRTAVCEVEDREEWEKEEEERDCRRKCSIEGSQGSISLLFLKRGSGGGWKHRERGTTLALYNLRHVRRSGKASWTRWRTEMLL